MQIVLKVLKILFAQNVHLVYNIVIRLLQPKFIR